jgi:helicase
MKLDEAAIDEGVLEILQGQGISEFYPPQEEAVIPILDGKSVVLALPTASGKSLVAYLAALKAALRGGKALYIVPLRALASEKYEELKAFEKLGIRVGMSVGDYDRFDPNLSKFHIVIATSEKADSLLRHRVDWLKEIDVAIADEIHLINDYSRGPTLEVLVSKLKKVNPDAQIIALSATIKNSRELADWLGAEHVESEWRPVLLKEGILYGDDVYFSDESVRHLTRRRPDPVESLLEDVIDEGGQALIFVNTRRSSEALAQRLGGVVKHHLKEADLEMLKTIAKSIEAREDESTSMGSRLARIISTGAAFHHAGLTNSQRGMVEDAFKSRKLRAIVATPTLAAGINLPARTVIVRDVKRYDANFGWIPIPVLEVKQMCGRAGRPRYDKVGEAVLLAKSEYDVELMKERYILGEAERIESKLGAEPALRMHLLALIATGFARTRDEVFEFIEHTFFAHQNEMGAIEDGVLEVMDFLEEEKLIESRDKGFGATPFGKRTSDLYIDPLSAVIMRNALRSETTTAMGYLHAICATTDMSKLYMRKKDYEWVEGVAARHEDELMLRSTDYEDYDFFLSELKTAVMVHDWMEELPENDITKKYDIGPGDIRTKVEVAEWLVYSMKELAKIFNDEHIRPLSAVIIRVQNGVKEELLPLVRLRGIGRVRARVLFNNGYRDIKALREADVKALSKLRAIGDGVAKSIKRQVEVL